MKININIYSQIVVFFCFVPYVSFIPLSTDMQPLALLLVIGFLLFLKSILINSVVIGMFIYIGVSLSFTNYSSINHIEQYFILLLSYLSFPLICLFGYNFKGELQKPLRFCLLFYLFFSFIQLFSPSFFKGYVSLIYNQKVIETGIRGWSSVTPEPTDLAFTCSIVIGVLLMLYKDSINKPYILVSLGVALFLIAGSLGVSGYLTSSFVFLCYFLTSDKPLNVKLAYIIFFLLVCSLMLILIQDTRVGMIVTGLISNPFYIISNTSLFYRVFENHLAILYTIEHSLLPAGFNGFYDAVKDISSKSHILTSIYVDRSDFIVRYFNNPPEFAKNVFSRSLIENGIVFIFGLIFLISYLVYSLQFRVFSILLILFILYLAQSFPLYYPPIWFMLGYVMKNYSKKSYKMTLESSSKGVSRL